MESLREKDVYPDFYELVQFISREADEANDPVYGKLKVTNDSLSSKNKSSNSTASFSSDVGKSSSSSSTSGNGGRKCLLCDSQHRLFYCAKFKEMKPVERLKFVNDHRLCKNCLLSNHETSHCRKDSVCSVPGCGQKHTKFIHINQNQNRMQNLSVNSETSRSGNSPQILNANADIGAEVFMPVVPVVVNGKRDTFALLDSASSSSFCSRSLVQSLGIQGRSTSYSLSTLSKTAESKQTSVVDLMLASSDGRETLMLYNVLVVDKIPVRCPPSEALHMYDHLRDLPIVDRIDDAEILIGQDN